MNLATVIDGHPASTVALISRGTTISYGDLADQVGRLRGGLVAAGLRSGDRVAIVAANNPFFVTAYLAVLGAGGVAVPLNPASPSAEVRDELSAIGARF